MSRKPSFRTDLYGRYVSTFKGLDAELTPAGLNLLFSWFRHKYLPLLQGCDRDTPVIELGCGAGYLMEFLQRTGFSSVEGIDVSPEQIHRARSRGLRAEQADVFSYLSSRGDRYGMIAAIDFLEHFTKDEITELLDLVRRALRPGGVLVLQTPNGQGLFPGQVTHGDFGHLTILAPGSLAQVLRLAGFVDIALHETGPLPLGWKGKVRSYLWRGIKAVANAVRRIETGKTQELWTENLICACRKPGDQVSARAPDRE